jgi:hypothetical protein
MFRFPPAEVRFWANVLKTPKCWEWQAALNQSGYGYLRVGAKSEHVMAHRYSWEMHCSAIPQGMFVCHKCDNPKCVRPDHLFLGTQADNLRDMWQKGRQGVTEPPSAARYRAQTHCKHGHLFDEANTYRKKNGGRQCRKCDAARAAIKRAARRRV